MLEHSHVRSTGKSDLINSIEKLSHYNNHVMKAEEWNMNQPYNLCMYTNAYLSARLQYLQCISTGDTTVLHKAINISNQFTCTNTGNIFAMHRVCENRSLLRQLTSWNDPPRPWLHMLSTIMVAWWVGDQGIVICSIGNSHTVSRHFS